MSSRISHSVIDVTGNGVSGLDVKLYRKSDNALLGTFTDLTTGEYYIDYAVTERVYIKVNGVTVPGSDGMLFPTEDTATYTILSSTNSGEGAAKIGIEDAAGRFTGTKLEAILSEILTLAELAATSGTSGGQRIGIKDSGGYYANTNAETILQEIGPIFALLSGLTSTAAELNKLHGASGNVTAANLNTLTAGTSSDAGSLHRHNLNSMLGYILNPQGTYADLWMQSNDVSGKGNIVLDVFKSGADGIAYVRKGNSGVATLYEIMTAKEAGTLNWAGNPILNGITTITNALLELAARAISLETDIGFPRLMIDRGLSVVAGSGDTDVAADPGATTYAFRKTASYKVARWIDFIQYPDMRYIKVRLNCKSDHAVTYGFAKVTVDTESSELTCPSTSYIKMDFTIDLKNLGDITVPTTRTLKIQLKGDAGGALGIYMNYDWEIWSER